MKILIEYTRTDDWTVTTTPEEIRKYVADNPGEFDEEDPFPTQGEDQSDTDYADHIASWIRDNSHIISAVGDGDLQYEGDAEFESVSID